ncbi:MAG: hypothetical protein KGQ59_09735, partial [Bdellovibrionales bacterium]|nr:hypothetical protein [Bdellovibrionales bacterium]
MKTFEPKIIAMWSALALTVLLSGCGGEAYRTAGSGGGYNPSGNVDPYVGPVSPPPSDDWSGGSSGGSGSGSAPTSPAFSFDFQVTGPGGTTPSYTASSVNTDNLLVVRISARPAGELSLAGGQYSRFTANYGCVAYEVTALGKTLSTGILSVTANNPLCPGAPSYADLNFSDRLASGHHAVNVQVTKVYYDFYCLWAKNQNEGARYYGP